LGKKEPRIGFEDEINSRIKKAPARNIVYPAQEVSEYALMSKK
jgi:hypothetical protein